MSDRTARLHRVLRCPPQRIYRTFLEPDATIKWLPPHGFTCQGQHMDVRVGGRFKMSFHNFSSGHGHGFGGEYLEPVSNARIRDTDRFDDTDLPWPRWWSPGSRAEGPGFQTRQT